MKSSLIILFLIFSESLLCQTTSGVITYTQIDTFGASYEVKMYFGEQKSAYVYNRGAKIKHRVIVETGEELDMKNVEKFAQQIKTGRIRIYYVDEEGETIYKDWSNNFLVQRDVNEFEPLLIREATIPTINWVIQTQTKQIGKFTCQKATTTFRGRNYEAWFSQEIPVSAGPWKLHGLPGLILEASDEAKTFQYKFRSVEVPLTDKTELLKIPLTGRKILLTHYNNELIKTRAEHLRVKLSTMSQGAAISASPTPVVRQELTFD